MLSQVKGKDITELVACGREQLSSVPSGGSGTVDVAAPATGDVAASPEQKEDRVEEDEESDNVSFNIHICIYIYWLKCLQYLYILLDSVIKLFYFAGNFHSL